MRRNDFSNTRYIFVNVLNFDFAPLLSYKYENCMTFLSIIFLVSLFSFEREKHGLKLALRLLRV